MVGAKVCIETIRQAVAARVDMSSIPAGGFEDEDVMTRLHEFVGAAEAGDAGACDDDLFRTGVIHRRFEMGSQGEACARGEGVLQEDAPLHSTIYGNPRIARREGGRSFLAGEHVAEVEVYKMFHGVHAVVLHAITHGLDEIAGYAELFRRAAVRLFTGGGHDEDADIF